MSGAFLLLVLGVLVLVLVSGAALVGSRRMRQADTGRSGVNFRGSRKPEHPLDGTDLSHGVLGETPDPKPLRAHLEIDYKDGNGSWTKRFVRVKEFDNHLDGGILVGHCELRGGTRTFRFDRIKQCVDIETGVVVADVQKYLNDIYSNLSGTPLEIRENLSSDET